MFLYLVEIIEALSEETTFIILFGVGANTQHFRALQILLILTRVAKSAIELCHYILRTCLLRVCKGQLGVLFSPMTAGEDVCLHTHTPGSRANLRVTRHHGCHAQKKISPLEAQAK